MPAVRISLATANAYVFQAIYETFRLEQSAQKDTPAVFLDGAPAKLERSSEIGATIAKARGRADSVRRRQKADLGVGLAYGLSHLACTSRPGKASFMFVVIVATDEKGAIAYGIPDIYPADLRPDICRAAQDAFTKVFRNAVRDDVLRAAMLCTKAWASLDFDDPQVELTLYN